MATDLMPPETDRKTSASTRGEGRSLHRLSVAQYEAMAQSGILTTRDRVELIDGLLVSKMTKKPPHQLVISNACYALIRLLPDDWLVRTESPLVLLESVPEPDVMILRGRNEDYSKRHPSPEDVALVIEVADATVAEDRARSTMFAAAGIPAYWLVNIPGDRIEVFGDPAGSGPSASYQERRDYRRGAEVTFELPGRVAVSLGVESLLPPE
ncbi:MAG: Uma2 family endonuclease [Isosphaeraceae bacterium]